MIKIDNTEVFGWEAAIRGMRNPMNSWGKSDSVESCDGGFSVGENDLGLMMRLSKAGTEHRKFMRMIVATMDVTAPLYWWKEFDTYKVGTVANSCSTMHKIADKEFSVSDFSCDKLAYQSFRILIAIVDTLNYWRRVYLEGDGHVSNGTFTSVDIYEPNDKRAWWQLIQLLPSSYNQRRTIQLNYEVLANIYRQRKNHRLDEWVEFCGFIKTLPYSELITGGEDA